MRRDLTTSPAHRLDASRDAQRRFGLLHRGIRLLATMLLGALLIALAYQVPAWHSVDIGGYDSAYVQGFSDPEFTSAPGAPAYLDGSDGSARWTRDASWLLFPQAGLPAQLTLRLRGRAQGPAPEVIVLLHQGPLAGPRELGRFRAGAGWEEHTFAIDTGLLKPEDVVVEIRAGTAPLAEDDPRLVGILLDRAIYRAGPPPIAPYPAQLLYGALAMGMLYLLLQNRAHPWASKTEDQEATQSEHPLHALRSVAAGALVMATLFLLLYRLQPPYPYPLRGLLQTINLALAALLALRYGPALARRAPALLDALALGGVGVWTAVVLLWAQDHVTLSVPGVEKDFRVFATRSADLGGVLRADGFYNLGYPLLLWLTRPLAQDNPFLAARLLAALSGALLLVASWWLARRLLGRGPALIALLILALSPLVVEYTLYLGTDMPFAALCTLALALVVGPHPPAPSPAAAGEGREGGTLSMLLAGLVAGMAFLVRHPGLLLLPFGWLALWRGSRRPQRTRMAIVFTLAFLAAISPQFAVNTIETGRPLYHQQAKNIWLAVYGGSDWGRWGEAPDDVALSQVVLHDPGRFLANWWANARAFFGTGAEDTSEFGRAVQLRLLGFPANWLAIVGVIGWIYVSWKEALPPSPPHPSQRERPALSVAEGRPGGEGLWRSSDEAHPLALALLLAWVALYVAAISVGFALPRFFLPLAPVYALAAAWLLAQGRKNLQLAAGLLLAVLLWGGLSTGAAYVLRNQPEHEVAAVRLVQAALEPGERLLVRVPPDVPLGKYSAIAHLAASAPAADTPQALRGAGARYLLWSDELGPAPAVGPPLGSAGPYTLYRIAP